MVSMMIILLGVLLPLPPPPPPRPPQSLLSQLLLLSLLLLLISFPKSNTSKCAAIAFRNSLPSFYHFCALILTEFWLHFNYQQRQQFCALSSSIWFAVNLVMSLRWMCMLIGACARVCARARDGVRMLACVCVRVSWMTPNVYYELHRQTGSFLIDNAKLQAISLTQSLYNSSDNNPTHTERE